MAFPWLIEALASARYLEDVRALKHFVFHPRDNGCSNLCLVCDCAVDTEGPGVEDWALGHLDGCPYPQAVSRVGQESVEAWMARR